ncbi:glycosyltransferase [Nocardioides dongxiaopingii]|uniref:glycosyltransferase n=1 Tax=Nocardioides dongxiaopingii TaxID=2576036 RepID=UPI00148565A7|nr:glycosyltransferase [Nocardioides dongxiaopingii]
MSTRQHDVLHFFASFERGGAETRTLEALSTLGELARDHRVVALANPAGPMREEFESLGARTSFRPLKAASGVWRLFHDLRKARVAHSHLGAVSAPVLILATLARVPVRVAHYRSDSTVATDSWRRRVLARTANCTVRWLATDIIGVSPSALTHGYSASWPNDPRCRVMLSGIPVPPLPEAVPDVHLRQELDIPEDHPVVVHVGRDTPDKNRGRALEIMAAVDSAHCPAHLVFVGRDDSAELDRLRERASSLGLTGRVHWVGQRTDVNRLLAGADVLLMTSRREGMPGVLLEALAVGLPAVASDVPGAVLISRALEDDVVCLSLGSNDITWADAVRSQLGRVGGPEIRRERRDRLANSTFELSRCVGSFRSLWHPSSAQPSEPAKARVVHLFSRLDTGGAEIRTLELIEWLAQGEAVHDQVVLQSGGIGTLTDRYERAGARVVSRRFRTPGFWSAAWQNLRDPRTVALHLHVKRGLSKPALLLPLAKWGGVPVRIVHFRSDGTHTVDRRLGRTFEMFYRVLIDRLATDIVGVSPAALQLGWREDWPSDPRCRVLLSGVRLDRFDEAGDVEGLRRELGAAAGDLVLVHVGRDAPLKNRARAIEILSALTARDIGAVLAFVGRDDEAKHDGHRTLAEAHGIGSRVTFLGNRDDVPAILATADALLMTSTQEGMPGVLLEALGAGTVAVVSDLPGTRYVADRLPGVTLCSLADADDVWVEALVKSQVSRPTKDELKAALVMSGFDTRRAATAFVDLWEGRTSPPG